MIKTAEKEMVSLDEVFSARSVAIVGASASGKMGFAEGVLMSLVEVGCPAIYPVY